MTGTDMGTQYEVVIAFKQNPHIVLARNPHPLFPNGDLLLDAVRMVDETAIQVTNNATTSGVDGNEGAPFSIQSSSNLRYRLAG
jgi:hypothetical protein